MNQILYKKDNKKLHQCYYNFSNISQLILGDQFSPYYVHTINQFSYCSSQGTLSSLYPLNLNANVHRYNTYFWRFSQRFTHPKLTKIGYLSYTSTVSPQNFDVTHSVLCHQFFLFYRHSHNHKARPEFRLQSLTDVSNKIS